MYKIGDALNFYMSYNFGWEYSFLFERIYFKVIVMNLHFNRSMNDYLQSEAIYVTNEMKYFVIR